MRFDGSRDEATYGFIRGEPATEIRRRDVRRARIEQVYREILRLSAIASRRLHTRRQ
jgi:hypothetical protein